MEMKASMRKIKKLLMADWDPIGVKDAPEAQDEYDAYAAGLATMRDQGSASSQLVEYLLRVEADMGLLPNSERAERVIESLLSSVTFQSDTK